MDSASEKRKVCVKRGSGRSDRYIRSDEKGVNDVRREEGERKRILAMNRRCAVLTVHLIC